MPLRFTILLLAAGFLAPASAQVRPVPLVRQLKLKQKQKQGKPALRPLPGAAVQRFLRMSPEDRQRALSQLPPERRQQMEQRLRRLEQLTPAQRAQLDRRYQIFEGLPPGRRAVVRDAIARLRAMPPAQRKAVLEGDDAKLRFNPEELQLLRDVVGLPEFE